LWSTLSAIAVFYFSHLFFSAQLESYPALMVLSHTSYELMNTMWWGLILAALFVGLLGNIPRELVTAVLGRGGSFGGILRATFAGLLMDLCSHGILMVGMKLYERGASLGQVFAFLIASPWNSLSLTIILISLIGWQWTGLFIVLSMVIGVITGLLIEGLVVKGVLAPNPHHTDLPENFQFWAQARREWSMIEWSWGLLGRLLVDGVKGSRMVLRWVFLGVLIASLIRAFVPLDWFQTLFGPTLLGLSLTLIATTIIEVCSEGSTPVAADLLTRANAPGNGFTFLMAGVATDYTEIMSIKDTTKSWKIALFLPLITIPQVLVVGYILNSMTF
jgi:hypothetical protein